MLGRLEAKPDRVVLVDCAGGTYLIALGNVAELDIVVVVVEPYPRSGEVARRLLATLSAEAPVTRVLVVANKIGQEADLDAVRGFLPGVHLDGVVPLDQAVVEADAEGRAPIELAPGAPAVGAIKELATMLR